MTLDVLAGGLRLSAAVLLLAAAARRWAPRLLPAGPRSFSETFLRVGLIATVFAVSSVAVLGAAGALGGWTLLLASAALYGGALFLPSPGRPPAGAGRRRVPWPLAPALLVLAVDAVVHLPASPVNWDAMTYHLYFPARWLQEGRLFHVPTVFSDDSAAFAPQNGALFFAWQMALLGSDATTNVSQLLCLLFVAAAVYRSALLLGARRQAALMAAATLPWLAPLRRWALSANVDVFLLAFWTGGVYWLLAYFRRGGRGNLVACGLALGLAAGTKTVGLPLAAAPAAVLALGLLWKRRGADLGLFAGAATAAGGWWYAKNLLLYGNPLFPLDFQVLGLRFHGAYTAATLRETLFRIDGLGNWLETVAITFGIAACSLLVAGWLGLAALAWQGRRIAAPALAVFAAAWTAYVYAVVPHNNQTRFLLPALAVAVVGWAGWLRAVPRRGWRAGLFLLGIAAAAWDARPHQVWAYHLERLAAAGTNAVAWMVLGLLAAAAAAWSAWRWRASGRHGFAVLAVLAFWPAVALASHHAGTSRLAFLARADYRVWGAGYLMFNDPALAPRRIAYSGVNVPYALMGPGFRHVVVYCNTQGDPDDGFYDFWARDPRLYPTHKPGLYRGADDFDVWRRCLGERGIDTVVVFATLPVERPAHWALLDDFPIEREWMRRRPDLFEPLLWTEKAEVYRVR